MKHADKFQTSLGIDNRPEKPKGLSIQDPNKPDNNISSGSHKAPEVFRVFSVAYDTLCERMKASKIGSFHGASLLDSIIGANYAAYIKQRKHLKNLP
jgi:non-canonical poly(A) RNA polymerase PAPD5/7